MGIILVLIVGGGYAAYNYFIGYASDMMVEMVAEELAINEAEYNRWLEAPGVQEMLEQMEVDEDTELIFPTKEDATRAIIREYPMGEITDVITKAQQGQMTIEQIEEKLSEKFTEEEIEALMILAIREMQGE